MSRWADRANEELEKQLDDGEISNKEYWEECREINEELREEARDNAEQAYNDTIGY